MQTLNIFKAQPVGDNPVQSIQIVLDKEMPDATDLDAVATGRAAFGIWRPSGQRNALEKAALFFGSEAQRLAQALIAALPGGTLDQLTVHLLRHKASLLAVPNTKE